MAVMGAAFRSLVVCALVSWAAGGRQAHAEVSFEAKRLAGKAGGHHHVFVDGVPGPAHHWAEDVSFDPAGKQIACGARDQPDGPWHIVAGKVSRPIYDRVGPPRWSSDGKRVAYAARSGREVWWEVLVVP